MLYFIEQGLMPKTGKRYEFETGQASGLPLIATIQDFDWADEVLHSQIGRHVVRAGVRHAARRRSPTATRPGRRC